MRCENVASVINYYSENICLQQEILVFISILETFPNSHLKRKAILAHMQLIYIILHSDLWTNIPLVIEHSVTKPRGSLEHIIKIKINYSTKIYLPDRNAKCLKEIVVEMWAAWISGYNWQFLCQFGQQLTKEWNNMFLQRWKTAHHSWKGKKAK